MAQKQDPTEARSMMDVVKPPCPPTPLGLIEHYARCMHVLDHQMHKEIFLRNILAVCKRLRDAGVGLEVMTPQQVDEVQLR